MEDVRVRLGKRVRQLRLKHGMTQVVLAEKLGLDRSCIADIERGNRNPSLMNLEVIANGFGLTLSQLLAIRIMMFDSFTPRHYTVAQWRIQLYFGSERGKWQRSFQYLIVSCMLKGEVPEGSCEAFWFGSDGGHQ